MNEPRRLLFITLSNIGDLVMTTPLLEALHLSYPDHLIDIVADRRSSELLQPCPYRGRLIHKDKNAGLTGTIELVRTLRIYPYDVAVDLRTAFLTLLIRCGQRGFKRRGTSVGPHAVQHHFTALGPILGQHIEIPPPCLWLDPAASATASSLLSELPAERRLVIAPGANWTGKIWPIDRYAALINHIDKDFDSVIVVGSSEDHELGERLQKSATLPLVNLAGRTSLLEAAACMAQAHAFVGNDSGLGHMAAALSIPTLTVFGPGRPHRYRPWGPLSAVVIAPLEDLAALESAEVARVLRAHLASPAVASVTAS
jgi:heptosyltransferase-3